ncbi:hypothetical protein [Nostoc sp.]
MSIDPIVFIDVFLGMGATRAIALSKCCVKEATIALFTQKAIEFRKCDRN